MTRTSRSSANDEAVLEQSTPLPDRRGVAEKRAFLAREHYVDCHLCSHHCGVNRSAGELGRCRANIFPRIFSAQIEVSDELKLIPTYAIAFSGCDLRCDFCITGKESWHPQAGVNFCQEEIAQRAIQALDTGAARTIMILGGEPTIYLPHVLELVAQFPNNARLIWKTNTHGSNAAMELLNGLFDYWVADYKFGNDDCAQRLAHVKNYTAIVRRNLKRALQQSDLIIRHLLMPGHTTCCWAPVAEWIASELPGVKVNLRTGFWPGWHSRKHVELRTTSLEREAKLAFHLGREYGLNLVA